MNVPELRQRFAQCSPTEKLLTVFTGILAIVAVVQVFIYSGQYKAMRIDERGWGEIIFAPAQIGNDEAGDTTVAVPFEVVNTGKTPALDFSAEFMSDIVKNGETPTFNIDEIAKITVKGSVIFTNSPTVNISTVKEPHSRKQRILSEADVKQLEDGKDYVISYGKVGYTDVFGHDHWQHFCVWASLSKKPVEIDSLACTKYNQIDDNY